MQPCFTHINFWKGEIAYRNNKIDDAIRYYNNSCNCRVRLQVVRSIQQMQSTDLGYSYLQEKNYPAALSFEPVGKNASLNSDAITQDAL